MMKTFISILIFSSFCQAAPTVTDSKDSLDIRVKNGEVEILLPAEAKKTLVQWNPEFIPFNLKDYSPTIQALLADTDAHGMPMGFVADLDSNGEKDIVLLGSDLKRQYAVALIQKNKTWKAVEISSWSLTDIRNTAILNPNAPGKKPEIGIPLYVLPAQDEHAKKLGKKIGIQTELYLGPAQVYEIKDDKAVRVRLK